VSAQIHGNVCMAAVVVTEQLDWRLHGFDLLSEHAGGPADMPLLNASWMVAQHYKPGEVQQDGELSEKITIWSKHHLRRFLESCTLHPPVRCGAVYGTHCGNTPSQQQL